MAFFHTYYTDYPHMQAINALLRISKPDLQLSYPLFNLRPLYIYIDVELPSGLKVSIEVSREFSYSFIRYIWL